MGKCFTMITVFNLDALALAMHREQIVLLYTSKVHALIFNLQG